MKVAELRKLCSSHKLATKGSKSQLIERLEQSGTVDNDDEDDDMVRARSIFFASRSAAS